MKDEDFENEHFEDEVEDANDKTAGDAAELPRPAAVPLSTLLHTDSVAVIQASPKMKDGDDEDDEDDDEKDDVITPLHSVRWRGTISTTPSDLIHEDVRRFAEISWSVVDANSTLDQW